MPNIGERLEEARKRQGVSLREAAEATKVRSDFLVSFENNQFEIDLPHVYQRGFLKLYARFLKMDVDKVMTDYNAVMLGNSKVGRRDARENLGRIDLPEQTKSIGGPDSDPPYGSHQETHGQANLKHNTSPSAPAEAMETQSDSGLYWKIGLVFVGGFIVVGLIALLIQSLLSGGTDETVSPGGETAIVSNNNRQESVATPANDNAGNSEEVGTFTIVANGDVLNVMVRQDKDREKLFGRSMQAGESVTITREGPVRVVSSDIDKITIELDGRKITSPSEGIGQIKLGMAGAEN